MNKKSKLICSFLSKFSKTNHNRLFHLMYSVKYMLLSLNHIINRNHRKYIGHILIWNYFNMKCNYFQMFHCMNCKMNHNSCRYCFNHNKNDWVIYLSKYHCRDKSFLNIIHKYHFIYSICNFKDNRSIWFYFDVFEYSKYHHFMYFHLNLHNMFSMANLQNIYLQIGILHKQNIG